MTVVNEFCQRLFKCPSGLAECPTRSGPKERRGFETATSDAFDMFQSILKIKMITVQVNGNGLQR